MAIFHPSNPYNRIQTEAELKDWREQLEKEEKRERQLQEIADSMKSLGELRRIADAAETRSKLALEKAKKADIKGWIAIIISAISTLVQIAINYDRIVEVIAKIITWVR